MILNNRPFFILQLGIIGCSGEVQSRSVEETGITSEEDEIECRHNRFNERYAVTFVVSGGTRANPQPTRIELSREGGRERHHSVARFYSRHRLIVIPADV